jgi:hypothetical protein
MIEAFFGTICTTFRMKPFSKFGVRGTRCLIEAYVCVALYDTMHGRAYGKSASSRNQLSFRRSTWKGWSIGLEARFAVAALLVR